MAANTQLAELEGLLRRGGVTIAPVNRTGTEELTLPAGDGSGGDETFLVTMNDQRQVQGEIVLYNTRTGEPVRRDINALKQELAKTHQDREHLDWFGKPMFTLDGGTVPKPEIGTLLCPLNPKHADWLVYKAVGARGCRKATLPHELAVQAHVRVKHQQVWDNLERKRKQELEDEEREWRRFQMRQAQTAAPVAPVAPPPPAAAPIPAPVSMACALCDTVVTGVDRADLSLRMQEHQQADHADALAAVAEGRDPNPKKK